MNAGTQRLEAVLDREIDAAQQLVATLAAERDALTGTAPEAVTRSAAQKIELFRTLERLEEERRALGEPANFGLPLSPPASPQTTGSSGVIETIAGRWRTLLSLIAACRSANEVNGYIVSVRQGQIRQLIDLVRGGSPGTYGPQGKTFARALRALATA